MSWVVKTEPYSAWDSGARTIASFNNDGAFTFTVGQATGIVCGLNSVDENAGYVEIDHAFFIDGNKAKVVEQGINKTTNTTFNVGAVFKLERLRGVVKYYIDTTLIYASLIESTGNVFGDCSLYSMYDEIFDAEIIDYAETNEGVAEISGTLPALAAKADEYAQVLKGQFPALSAKGSEFSTILVSTFPALTVEGVVHSGDRLYGTIPAIKSFGAVGVINFINAELPAFTASGSDLEEFIPEYADIYGELPRLHAGGYELIDENNHVDSILPAVKALGVENNINYGYAVLHNIEGSAYLGYSNYFGLSMPGFSIDFRQLVDGAGVFMMLPVLNLTATGNDDDNISAALFLPALTLTTQLGARTSLVLPALELTLAATSEGFATVDLTLPTDLALEAIGYVGEVAHSALTIPAPTLTAELGAYASLEMVAPVLASAATVIDLAQARLTLPFLELTSTGETYGFATVMLELPELELLSGPSRVELELPMLVLTAHAVPASAVSATTYAVNLTSGAMTQLLLGEFDKLVVANGRLYGLQGTALYRLEGDNDGLDDEDEPIAIPATVHFAPQTFGVNQLKRMSDVYLSTRETDGLTLSVIADETTAWQYQTPTDKALAYGTHKVKTGRGVTFYTVGLRVQNRNGGRLDVGGMELLAIPLSRKI